MCAHTHIHTSHGCHFEPNCFNTSCQGCKILLWYQWPARSRITRMCLKIVQIPGIHLSFSLSLLRLTDRPGKNSTSKLWVQSQKLWFRFIRCGREKWWTRAGADEEAGTQAVCPANQLETLAETLSSFPNRVLTSSTAPSQAPVSLGRQAPQPLNTLCWQWACQLPAAQPRPHRLCSFCLPAMWQWGIN